MWSRATPRPRLHAGPACPDSWALRLRPAGAWGAGGAAVGGVFLRLGNTGTAMQRELARGGGTGLGTGGTDAAWCVWGAGLTWSHMQACSELRTHTCMHTHTDACMQACMPSHTQTCTRACMHMSSHTYAHTITCAHTSRHMQVHTHTCISTTRAHTHSHSTPTRLSCKPGGSPPCLQTGSLAPRPSLPWAGADPGLRQEGLQEQVLGRNIFRGRGTGLHLLRPGPSAFKMHAKAETRWLSLPQLSPAGLHISVSVSVSVSVRAGHGRAPTHVAAPSIGHNPQCLTPAWHLP